AAKVHRVDHNRIDHQRPRLVILSEIKGHRPVFVQLVTGRDQTSASLGVLISDRSSLSHTAFAGDERKAPVSIYERAINSVESQSDRLRISAGGDDEVVFQPALCAGVGDVNSGINFFADNARISGDVRVPL